MRASLVAQMVRNLPAMQETWVQSLGREDLLEEGMAIHSSILAWRTPWTEEPGGPQFMGHKESDTTERLTHSYFHSELDGEWEISIKLSDPKEYKEYSNKSKGE